MIAHCNLKQNMCLCSKQSSFFPFMHCPLVANQKTRWSISKLSSVVGNILKLRRLILNKTLTDYFSVEKTSKSVGEDTDDNVNSDKKGKEKKKKFSFISILPFKSTAAADETPEAELKRKKSSFKGNPPRCR